MRIDSYPLVFFDGVDPVSVGGDPQDPNARVIMLILVNRDRKI